MAMDIAIIALVVFGANFFGTLVGFGTSMIMEPILFLSVIEPTSFLVSAILHCTSGIYRALLFRKDIVWNIVIAFAIPAVLAAIIGSVVLLEMRLTFFGHLLGIFLILYVLFSLRYPTFVMPNTNTVHILGGAVTGFFAGLFGIRGALQAAFLSSYQLPEKQYIATSSMIGLSVDIARLSMYIAGGMRLTPTIAHYLIFFIPVALLGVKAAHVCVPYIPRTYFRWLLAAVLLIIGIMLAGGFYELIA